MEHRAPIHGQGQLISVAPTAMPALGTKPHPSQIPSPAADTAEGWGPLGAVAAETRYGSPTALSNTASLGHDMYPSPEGSPTSMCRPPKLTGPF